MDNAFIKEVKNTSMQDLMLILKDQSDFGSWNIKQIKIGRGYYEKSNSRAC